MSADHQHRSPPQSSTLQRPDLSFQNQDGKTKILTNHLLLSFAKGSETMELGFYLRRQFWTGNFMLYNGPLVFKIHQLKICILNTHRASIWWYFKKMTFIECGGHIYILLYNGTLIFKSHQLPELINLSTQCKISKQVFLYFEVFPETDQY